MAISGMLGILRDLKVSFDFSFNHVIIHGVLMYLNIAFLIFLYVHDFIIISKHIRSFSINGTQNMHLLYDLTK